MLYVIQLVGVFVVISLIAVVAETQILEHFFFYTVPLAAIAFVITGILIPVLAGTELPQRWWTTPIAVLVALGLGIGLAGQGDEESGELFLPPRPVLSAALSTTESSDAAQPTATRPAPTAGPAPTPKEVTSIGV